MTKIAITCFTDIKDSTVQMNNLGQNRMQQITNEFLRIGKLLTRLNGGDYIKDLGDSHMVSFENIEAALQFATELQQYYQEKPCINRKQILVRIALYLGAVQPVNNDVFGPGAIKAKRIEPLTPATKVTINKDLQDKIKSIWGAKRAIDYFESIGKHELKGFDKEEELYDFNWTRYAQNNPEETLAGCVFKCLESAETVPTNLKLQEFNPPGIIIWPVVPRKIATAIHRGQIEIMRLIAFLGWRIHLLVADCGTIIPVERDDTDNFVSAILDHAKKRGLRDIEQSFLSDYYKVNYAGQKDILYWFHKITKDLKVQELIDINQKDYPKEIKNKVLEPTLDFLRPVLTCAAVLHLTRESSKKNKDAKTIIVVGVDEKLQWRHLLLNIPSVRLGGVYNPIFKMSKAGGQSYTALQENRWPIWHSQKELYDDIEKTNAGKWVFQLFIQLTSFPAPYVSYQSLIKDDSMNENLTKENFNAKEWKNEFEVPANIDPYKLVSLAWPILEPPSVA